MFATTTSSKQKEPPQRTRKCNGVMAASDTEVQQSPALTKNQLCACVVPDSLREGTSADAASCEYCLYDERSDEGSETMVADNTLRRVRSIQSEEELQVDGTKADGNKLPATHNCFLNSAEDKLDETQTVPFSCQNRPHTKDCNDAENTPRTEEAKRLK